MENKMNNTKKKSGKRANSTVTIRDVMFLCHPKPNTKEREELYKRIADRSLKTPDTWEVNLSSGGDKKEVFTKLIKEGKLGGLAFLRNLRNIEQAKVDFSVVQQGFNKLPKANLLPLNFYSAYQHSTTYADEINTAMIATFSNREKLPGHTVFVLDVSGSMSAHISGKSTFSRMDVGAAMLVLARECTERCTIYLTAGSDSRSKHKTERVKNLRGFALSDLVKEKYRQMGGGGIFTRQCIEYIKSDINEKVDRIIVFSDSQDCDRYNKQPAQPFGKYNYIIDVSAHQHGVNYHNTWDCEISGWSEHFIDYIQAYEGISLQEQQED